MTDPEGARGGEDDDLDVAKYLWEEYRYRHDMIWKLVFRVTAVATALIVAPFLVDESIRKVLDGWLVFLPILAIAVILLGFYSLPPELELLHKVKVAYRCEQNRVLHHLDHSWWTPHPKPPIRTPHPMPPISKSTWWQKLTSWWRRRISGGFEERVRAFLFLMLGAAIVFLVLFVEVWLRKIQ